mgnify:CR=1 FL=1
MKKKLACMLLMSALALSMTACGGKNSDSDVDYIKDMALKEQELENAKSNVDYACISR